MQARTLSGSPCGKLVQVSVETRVGLADKRMVEAPRIPSRFCAGYQEYGLACRVECKGETPYSICSVEAEFLHVGVSRSVQGIYTGATDCGPLCSRR